MRKSLYIVVVMIVMVFSCSTSFAGHVTINYRINDIASVEPVSGEKDNLHIVDMTIPQEVIGKRLDAVIIEFYLDVEHTLATQSIEYFPVSVSPALYQLETEGIMTLDLSKAVTLPVRAGSSRHVSMDITSLVKDLLEKAETHENLVIGLTDEVTTISSINMRSDGFDEDTVIRVTYYYGDRFGGKAPR